MSGQAWTSGWHSFRHGDGMGVHVRFRQAGDRYAISDVYVEGSEITGATLRTLRLGQYEAMANSGVIKLEHATRRRVKELSLADLRGRTAAWRATVAVKARGTRPRPRTRPRLTRPDRSDPAGFYQAVAAAYVEYVQQTRAVAIRIAEEAGVPVTTAHRWIREARRRGALPTGSQGKAG